MDICSVKRPDMINQLNFFSLNQSTSNHDHYNLIDSLCGLISGIDESVQVCVWTFALGFYT